MRYIYTEGDRKSFITINALLSPPPPPPTGGGGGGVAFFLFNALSQLDKKVLKLSHMKLEVGNVEIKNCLSVVLWGKGVGA